MSSLPTDNCFVLVIKTDSYAGNFEREMCGYMTGQVGECGVGDDSAVLFIAENHKNYEFEDLVTQFPDEHGCHRPATIWGPGCTDVAIYFESQPTDRQLVFLRQRACEFAAMTDPLDGEHTVISIVGFELIEYTVNRIETSVKTWGIN